MADANNAFFNSVLGNSFIANVNLLSTQFTTLTKILEVPDEVKKVRDEVNDKADSVSSIVNAGIALVKSESDKAKDSAKVAEINAKASERILGINKRLLRESCDRIKSCLCEKKIVQGVKNVEYIYCPDEDLKSGTILYFKTFKYVVGRNTLRVSMNGVQLYRCIHFEEVGKKEEFSNAIRLLVDVKAGATLDLFNISSNITDIAVTEFRGISSKLDEAKVNVENYLMQANNGVECMKSIAKAVNERVTKLSTSGFSLCVIADATMTRVPDFDTFFIYDPLATSDSCMPVMGTDGACTCGGHPESLCSRVSVAKSNLFK